MKLLKKIRYNSPVVLTFSLLSLLILGLDALTHGGANRLLFSVYRCSWADPLAYIRIFTHALGHQNFAHYAGNITLMLVIGPSLEEKYGGGLLLIMMLLTSLVSGVVHMIFSGTMLLGASGLVFMMIILASLAGMEQHTIPLTLVAVLLIYLGNEVADGIFTNDNISHMTHIVGGLCGAVCGLFVNNSIGKRRAA